jgi:hypothetical protein
MRVKKAYIRSLSETIKIVEAETKKEISVELSKLDTDLTELTFKSWALESFVININEVFDSILRHFKSEKKQKEAKDTVFKEVLKVNPLLDPEELYIDVNQITLTKTPNKLVKSKHWKLNEDTSNIPIITDFHKYFELSKQARGHDHQVETEYSSILEMGVKVRIFNKKLRDTLMFGFNPKSEQDVKYYVIITCIDSLHDILTLIKNDPEKSLIPFSMILDDLYEWSINHNSFLDLKIKDIKKINKTTKEFIHAVGKDTTEETRKVGRTHISQVPKEEILDLEETLSSQVFGQDEPIQAVADAYKRAFSGIKNPNIPVGSFLFYGGTSTGKTELARVLSKVLTKSPSGLIKIPCNTLQASHSSATLIGAPPGYVGYEDGCLSENMQDSSFKVILFDELDKAHPNIYDLLLEMLEEGKLMISNGDILDFTQCMIIFTSNMGQNDAQKEAAKGGFSAGLESKEVRKASEYLKIIHKEIKPEFLARLTGKFYFSDLTEETLEKTGKRYIEVRTEHLKTNKIHFSYPEKLPGSVLERCKELNPKGFHARDLNNYIETEIFQKLGNFIIRKGLTGKRNLSIGLSITENGYTFRQKADKINKRTKKK